MTTVAAGSTGSYTFTYSANVIIDLAANGRAIVDVFDGSTPVFGDRVSASKTIGPFRDGYVMTITADGANVDYTIEPYQTAPGDIQDLSPTEFVAMLSDGNLSTGASYRVDTGTYGFTYIAGQYFLDISSGGSIDQAFSEWVSVVRPIAEDNQGRVGSLNIASGNYSVSSTTSTMTVEPWMNIKALGVVKINHNGATVPTFWIRADVAPYFSMGNDSATNTTPSNTAETNFSSHAVIDGTNGPFILQSTRVSGGAAFRFGNGDGVWGTNYTTDDLRSAILLEVTGVHAMFYQHGIQFTNNNSFCSRWRNSWFSNLLKTIVTSTSNAEDNAYEQHSFINFFSNNIDGTHVEYNSTGNRDHQFSFGTNCSLTYCAGPVVTFNTSAQARVEMNGIRCENFTYLGYSAVASPRTWLRMSNVTVIPTNTIGPSLTTHLRKMFVGTFNVQAVNTQFNLTGNNTWNTVAYGQASNQFLADDTVIVQALNTMCDDPPGTNAENNNVRVQPAWNKSSNLIFNGNFETAALAGWTTGGTATIAATTTAGEFFDGSAGCRVTMAAQAGTLTSEMFPVNPGRVYAGNLVARLLDTTATTTVYVALSVRWYRSDRTTEITTGLPTPTAQDGTYNNWYNRRSATQWFMHPTGTGRLVAPAGAAFAQLVIAIGSAVAGTGNVTGTMYLDNACMIEC